MPRRKATAELTEQTTAAPTATLASEAPTLAAAAPATGENSVAAERERPAYGPDPRELMRATLGPSNDSPKMQLLRSHQYNQMQIHSDEPLSEKHQAMLTDAGWKDRTEQEGVWTKQLPKGRDDEGNMREKWARGGRRGTPLQEDRQ